jgi:hypothetical protein
MIEAHAQVSDRILTSGSALPRQRLRRIDREMTVGVGDRDFDRMSRSPRHGSDCATSSICWIMVPQPSKKPMSSCFLRSASSLWRQRAV